MKRSLGSLLIVLLTMLGIGAGIVLAATTGNTSVTKTVGQTALLSWTAPATYTNGNAIPSSVTLTYDVFSASQATGTTCASLTAGTPTQAGLTGTSYTTPAYATPGVWCYAITSIANGVMSVPSNTVQVTVTNPTPNPPQATVQ